MPQRLKWRKSRKLQDYIQCPAKSSFIIPAEYYETLFHELIHWSEHPQRLDWSRKQPENNYGLGELIAEVGSCFLSQELGVPQSENLGNHAAYLMTWLEAMKGDSRFIFTASAQASKAADYLLSFSRTTEPEHEPEVAMVQ